MGKADGAHIWARVLSELADVPVTLEYERPAWRVYWQDGPTREALMSRAAALAKYRVGAPLPAEELRFIRTNSVTAIALAWLANGSPRQGTAAVQARVETWCEDTGYPQARFDDRALAQADLLARLGQGDTTQMQTLLAQAVPPLAPTTPTTSAGPALTGRVTSYSWPHGGPPPELLGPEPLPARTTPACQRCGKPLPAPGRGRPAKFCGTACRVAAHRAAA